MATNTSELFALMVYQAQMAKNRGSFAEALGYYRAALKLDPSSRLVCRGLAHLVYDSTSECGPAEVRQLLVDHSCSPSSLTYFDGLILHRHGCVGKSTELFRKAVSLDPTNYYALNNLGFAMLKFGNDPRIIAIFRRALRGMRKVRDRRGCFLVLSNIALYQARIGKPKSALRQLEHLRSSCIDDYFAQERSYVLWNTGELYLSNLKLEKARKFFEQCCDHSSANHISQTYVAGTQRLAAIELLSSSNTNARQLIQEGLATAVISGDKYWESQLRCTLAEFYIAVEDFTAAQTELERVLPLCVEIGASLGFAAFHRTSALLHSQQDHPDRSVHHLTRAATIYQLANSDVDRYDTLVRLCFEAIEQTDIRVAFRLAHEFLSADSRTEQDSVIDKCGKLLRETASVHPQFHRLSLFIQAALRRLQNDLKTNSRDSQSQSNCLRILKHRFVLSVLSECRHHSLLQRITREFGDNGTLEIDQSVRCPRRRYEATKRLLQEVVLLGCRGSKYEPVSHHMQMS